MKNFVFYLIFFMVLSSFVKEAKKVSDVAQVLTNGAWIQVQSLSDDDGDGVFTDNSLTCEYDNTWVFNSDSTMTINDIGVLCAPDFGPITISGYWLLGENDTTLSVLLSQGFTQEVFNIAKITSQELILDTIDPENPLAAPTERYVLHR